MAAVAASVRGSGLAAFGLQPVAQCRGRRMDLRGLMQAFGQVQQVGQAAFTVGPRQQALADLLGGHPLSQHHTHAALLPELAVVAVPLHGGQCGRLVSLQRVQRGGVAAQQRGGQGSAQHRFACGLEHAAQHLRQLERVAAGEHAGLAVFDAAHTQTSQDLADQQPLGVAAHQHGHVAGLQAAAVQGDEAPPPGLQQPRNLASAGKCRGLPGRWFGQQRAVGGQGQLPQLQRRARQRLVDQHRALLGTTADRRIVQPGQHEGARVGAEQGVQRRQQGRRGALVFSQRVLGRRLPAGMQVGVQVGMAKTVDGLLGVADQEQRRLAAAVQGAENRKLQRVGVLKLVDQRGREACAQGLRQCRAVGAGEPLVQIEQHVVKGLHPAFALGRAQCVGAVAEQPAQQAQPGPGQLLAQAAAFVEPGLGGVEKRLRRHGRLALLGLQAGAAQQVQPGWQVGARQAARAVEQGIPTGRAAGHRIGPVDRAVQARQGVADGGHDRRAVCQPQAARRGPSLAQGRAVE